jgi:hypothetical protein
VACLLEMPEQHDRYQMADMEGVRSRIETNVGRRHFFLQLFLRTRHYIMYHAAPSELLDKIHGKILPKDSKVLSYRSQEQGF